MLTKDEVVEAVCEWLRADGYEITQRALRWQDASFFAAAAVEEPALAGLLMKVAEGQLGTQLSFSRLGTHQKQLEAAEEAVQRQRRSNKPALDLWDDSDLEVPQSDDLIEACHLAVTIRLWFGEPLRLPGISPTACPPSPGAARQ